MEGSRMYRGEEGCWSASGQDVAALTMLAWIVAYETREREKPKGSFRWHLKGTEETDFRHFSVESSGPQRTAGDREWSREATTSREFFLLWFCRNVPNNDLITFYKLKQQYGRQQLPYSSYFFLFTSDKITCDNEKYCGPLYWKSWLREHLLTIEREKATFPQSSYSHYEGVNILLGSIAYSLVIFPAFDNSEVDPLVAFGIQNPKQGMKIFQAALFYINILLKFESNSSKILVCYVLLLFLKIY
ncbi:hypothetical protein KFK09_024015 [Dendrobium nobile]|uniref:Uncharacterized protein n=1 Tax=Dendrobium nobile TaxID=94219 RepID=A0A8T3ACN8_DENNO|nr:hypothetical protein KFK09_024015 [Dendrobium nobile]